MVASETTPGGMGHSKQRTVAFPPEKADVSAENKNTTFLFPGHKYFVPVELEFYWSEQNRKERERLEKRASKAGKVLNDLDRLESLQKRAAKRVEEYVQIVAQNVAILYELSQMEGYIVEVEGKSIPFVDSSEYRKAVRHYVALCDRLGGDWMALFKYKLAAFFAYWMESEIMPPVPKGLTEEKLTGNRTDQPDKLLGGKIGRWMTLTMKKISSGNAAERTRACEFITSLANSKKGMARADKETLAEKEVELVTTLSMPEEEFKEKKVRVGAKEVTITKDLLVHEIQRTVKEVFRKAHAERLEMTDEAFLRRMTKAYFPSTSANYIRGRNDAGSVGVIMEDPDIDLLRQAGGYIRKKERTGGKMEEDRRAPLEEDFEHVHDRDKFDEVQREMFEICLIKAIQEDNLAEPVALAEALKIRVITKMPPFRSFVLKFLQKMMHKVVRNHNSFRFIGSPTGGEETMADYLTKVMDLEKAMEGDEIFVSGDYKAATDNLKSWASEAAANAVADALLLPGYLRRLFIESLTQHVLVKGELRGKQTKGQLMGSITSFPILCLVNAAITRLALEIGSGKKLRIDECRATFNGDDVVFRSTKFCSDWWRAIVGLVGLEESVGKTYYSAQFLQINSTNFIKEDQRLVLVKYVNSGLMKGMKRSGGQVDLVSQTEGGLTVGQNYRELLRMAPERLHKECHNKFFSANQHVVDKFQEYGIPWHVPEWLGGAGFTGYKQPTHKDRCQATKILFNWKKAQPRSYSDSAVEWKIRQFAVDKLPKPQWTEDPEHPGIERYNKLVNDKTLDILLDSNILLEDILPRISDDYDEEAEEKSRFDHVARILKHNSKLWKINPNHALPHAMSLEDMEYRPKYAYYGADDRVLKDVEEEEFPYDPENERRLGLLKRQEISLQRRYGEQNFLDFGDFSVRETKKREKACDRGIDRSVEEVVRSWLIEHPMEPVVKRSWYESDDEETSVTENTTYLQKLVGGEVKEKKEVSVRTADVGQVVYEDKDDAWSDDDAPVNPGPKVWEDEDESTSVPETLSGGVRKPVRNHKFKKIANYRERKAVKAATSAASLIEDKYADFFS